MAYAKTSASVTKLFEFRGLNCQEISIGDLKGLCIVPPRVGPVNTAISVAKSIDYFQPKIVTMSGICAGFGERVGLLDIIVADTVWDYSVGKETDSGFKSEQYQQTIDDSIRTYINQMIEDGSLLESFKHELFSQEVCNFKLLMGPVVSGSAVVASRSKMLEIGEQHRKVLGLDMEISALYEAAARSLNKPLFLAVKSVVDTGDANKDDSVHDKACILSAKFLVKFINDFCCRLTSK
jgi:nucleoside phosphorylase